MRRYRIFILLMWLIAMLTGCSNSSPPAHTAGEDQHTANTADGEHHAQHGDHEHHGEQGTHDYTAPHAVHSFADAERYAKHFDNPERDAWQRPAEVVSLLGLKPGHTVADIGAGTGYFLPHLAPAVAPGGRVLGLDIEPAMVEYMQARIAREGIAGAEARRVAPDDPELAPASTDRMLVVNTWHHIGDRVAYAGKLRQALTPGGFVLVIDLTKESEHGPPPSARIPPEQVVEELRQAGLKAEIVSESLPDQYAVRGTKQ
ncbi:class I SAM-dependent methyltransferase [Haliangium sp.]|uniref:class I SAM-dependent methyltransferase n=1 Tax=Haliangium sp. TaxID=2663208 RepID=UPI003D0D2A80